MIQLTNLIPNWDDIDAETQRPMPLSETELVLAKIDREHIRLYGCPMPIRYVCRNSYSLLPIRPVRPIDTNTLRKALSLRFVDTL
jgi:hypothetical protein